MKDIQATEYISAKEICKTLKVQLSTLRKYAALLDEKAHTEFYFDRDEQNNRMYTQDNAKAFKRVMLLKNKPNYTLNDAINEVIGLEHRPTTDTHIAVNEQYVEVLQFFVVQQTNYLEEYQSALQKKDEQIDRKDEQIDRLESLVSSLIENNVDKKKKWFNFK